jgi:kynurenine formamidase
MRLTFPGPGRRRAAALALAWLVPLASCAGTPTLDESRLVDLSQAFVERTPTAPGEPPLHYERVAKRRDDGRWLSTGTLHGSIHSGTHLDAPVHYSEGRRAADEVPLAQLVAPIRLIESEPGERTELKIGIDALRKHEREHGRIPVGAAVLIRTGWSRYWTQPERYLGGKDENRIPGITVELARELVARKVDLVGIDTLSLDAGVERDVPAQRALADANIPWLENLSIPPDFPETGATLVALPLELEGGGSSPARVVAIVP